MRHKKTGRKLGILKKHRQAMFRNMATDLFRHNSIKTTDTRAKELRRLADRMVTLAKDGSLHARRKAATYIKDPDVLSRLFDELAEKYRERPGGYTRIIKLGYRKGDNSPISLIELVQEEYKPKKKSKKSKPKSESDKTEAKQQKQEKSTSTKKESAKELGLADEEAVNEQSRESDPETIETKTEKSEKKAEESNEVTEQKQEELKSEQADETEIEEDDSGDSDEQQTPEEHEDKKK